MSKDVQRSTWNPTLAFCLMVMGSTYTNSRISMVVKLSKLIGHLLNRVVVGIVSIFYMVAAYLDDMIIDAKTSEIALLVIGDPFG